MKEAGPIAKAQALVIVPIFPEILDFEFQDQGHNL
jgi:hypothetical protein